jgi:hypothetical protein
VAAASYNFTIEQGATFEAEIEWRDGSNALVNLTGFSARMQIRTSIAAASFALELTNANGRIVLGGAAGTVQLVLAAADTAALGAGSYVYDLELVHPSGKVTRLLKGAITVDAEVTR